MSSFVLGLQSYEKNERKGKFLHSFSFFYRCSGEQARSLCTFPNASNFSEGIFTHNLARFDLPSRPYL